MEAEAWSALLSVVKKFLGNHKALNYKEIIQKMLKCLKNSGTNMSIKIYFLHSYLDKLSDNWKITDKQWGKRFCQDFRVLKERYQGR